MKKNNSLRYAALLLVLVLMTCCFVGGTMAKYVTSVNASDETRVAYWGWKQESITIDLFDDNYDGTVDSENGDNVIAPGTSKTSTIAFKYDDYSNSGTELHAPEVDYNFEVNVDVTAMEDIAYKGVNALDENENFVWTLKTPANTSVQEFQTLDAFMTAIQEISGSATGSKDYEANKLPLGFDAGENEITLGWKWNFSKNATGDEDDTAMGNATNLDDLKLTITITATQLD